MVPLICFGSPFRNKTSMLTFSTTVVIIRQTHMAYVRYDLGSVRNIKEKEQRPLVEKAIGITYFGGSLSEMTPAIGRIISVPMTASETTT